MESAAPPRARPSPRRQQQQGGKLPQPPRRREEFAASSKLANAGAKIAAPGGAADASKKSPRRPQQSNSPPRRENTSARGGRSQNGSPSRRDNPSARGGNSRAANSARDAPAPASGASSPTDPGVLEQAAGEQTGTKAGEDLTARPRGEVKPYQAVTAGSKMASEEHHVDAIELARGGEVLLQRLADVNAANSELKRQLELQVHEVSTLQEAGNSQQQLLREFERQAEQARQAQRATIEAEVRAEIGEREEKLKAQLAEATEQARLDREDLMNRLQQMKGEVMHVQGERDEARERLRDCEERLGIASNTPGTQVSRAKGLEMELSLVKARFARETEAKKAAERASAESRAQQQELKVQLEKEGIQVRQLQKMAAEQTELANFRQEICNDLQLRLKDQKSEAESKLRYEKGKHEVVNRLEGILPRHFLMQALN